jgi:RNA polymerase-binding transcription factor DksA
VTDAPDDALDAETLRTALAAERAGALARAAALRRDLDALKEAATIGGTDDEHDPEGTTAFERAQAQSLLDAALGQVEEVDVLLARVEAGTYGVCETCGRRIAAERLLARPLARTCITCASARR